MAKKKSIHSNVGKRYIKSYSKEKGYEYFKNKAEHDKAISKANKKATHKLTGKVAKKAGKSLVKGVAGTVVPFAGAGLAAAEVYKAGKKGLKDRKSRKSCEKKGGVWQKGYCITRSSKKKK